MIAKFNLKNLIEVFKDTKKTSLKLWKNSKQLNYIAKILNRHQKKLILPLMINKKKFYSKNSLNVSNNPKKKVY